MRSEVKSSTFAVVTVTLRKGKERRVDASHEEQTRLQRRKFWWSGCESKWSKIRSRTS